jgi:site-specific recombinase XerD
MNRSSSLPVLIEGFFTERLMRQQHASAHTIASYRDTFRLLLGFASQQRKRSPSELELSDLDALLISAFLDDQQTQRAASTRTRNLRLTAIRSFFRFVAFEEPAHSAHIQRVLAIPSKRGDKKLIYFLNRVEIEAILDMPDRTTWLGRRDHALLLLAIQTGLRLSELTSLDRESIAFGTGAHVRCIGKGRKERCTPLSKPLTAVLQRWLKEPPPHNAAALFPNVHGGRLSADAVQYLLRKYVRVARARCPSLRQKRISPHVLRHTAAMELLQAGVDCSVIALWLGHESMETTQIYLHAHMALKEAALAKVTPMKGGRTNGRYRPPDRLLQFLHAL